MTPHSERGEMIQSEQRTRAFHGSSVESDVEKPTYMWLRPRYPSNHTGNLSIFHLLIVSIKYYTVGRNAVPCAQSSCSLMRMNELNEGKHMFSNALVNNSTTINFAYRQGTSLRCFLKK